MSGFQGQAQPLLAVAQFGLAVPLQAVAVQDGDESQARGDRDEGEGDDDRRGEATASGTRKGVARIVARENAAKRAVPRAERRMLARRTGARSTRLSSGREGPPSRIIPRITTGNIARATPAAAV